MFKRKMFLLVLVIVMISSKVGWGADTTNSKFADREFVVGIPMMANTMDPMKNPYEKWQGYQIGQSYDTLVTLDVDGNIKPWLAESWEIGSDGLSITFHLRKGVKFWNGDELTASDVKFSLERSAASVYCNFAYTSFKDATVIDDYTVRANFTKPDAAWLKCITHNYYGFIVNKRVLAEYGDTGGDTDAFEKCAYGSTVDSIVGTGPYIITEWIPNTYIKYKANPDYFMGEPSIKNLKITLVTDLNAVVMALQSGDMNLFFNTVPVISWDRLERSGKVNVERVVPYMDQYVILNVGKNRAAFKDIRLRQAVAYCIDKDMLNIIQNEGEGLIIDYTQDGADTAGNPRLKGTFPYSYDIDKATELIKEAGAVGMEVVMKTVVEYSDVATAIAHELNKAGFNARVQLLDITAWYEDVAGNGNYDLSIAYNAPSVKDMDLCWRAFYHTESYGWIGNCAWYADPLMDELLYKGKETMDPEKRKGIYAECVKIAQRDLPYIALWYNPEVRVYTKDVIIDKGYAIFNKVFYFHWNE